MPNLNSVLGEEIRRLARKEIKVQIEPLQKANSRYRAEIAELKRRLAESERGLGRVQKEVTKAAGKAASNAASSPVKLPRFSASWVKKHREKLGLSAADYGKLAGVSGLTIYNWEKGESNPREKQLLAWGEVRTLGKREARKRLDAMEESAEES
ncbi:MAG: helix-turn-helix domain-containing protein [Planctomycetota bacterium]